MYRPSTVPGRWSTLAGTGIVLLGAVLLLMPVGGQESAVPLTGGFVIAAALMELAVALKSSRAPVRHIELVMSCITLGSALLILLNPGAYPLIFVASFCLAVRGVGAVVAAANSAGAVRWWVVGRGVLDLLLAAILIAGAPFMAVISVVSGVPWPPKGAAVLTNFVALSLLVTGISLLGVGMTHRRSGNGTATGDAPDS